MRMLSDRMHWLTVGLALLVGLGGALDYRLNGQAPTMGSDTPSSMSFPGPAPMGVDSSSGRSGDCDDGQSLFGAGLLRGPFGNRFGRGLFGGHGNANACGTMACGTMGFGSMGFGSMGCGSMGCGSMGCGTMGCGTMGCGTMGCPDDGLLGSGPLARGLLGSGACATGACGPSGGMGGMGQHAGMGHYAGMGCGACGGVGCLSCIGAEGALFSGHMISQLLGPLAPYSEGAGSQRWFDVYAGTIAWSRSTGIGPVTSTVQVPAATTPIFNTTDIISTVGTGTSTPALRTTDLDLGTLRYGLELVGNIQTGPGANVEVRYFGLNNWNDTLSVQRTDPELFSIFSEYGTNPGGIPPGFDDTDRSFIHSISLDSKFDNGEVNYRRRWVGHNSAIQGSWMGGIRYFELDENFGFAAVGSNDNTFTFSQLRFFDMDTATRNHLVGFQLGGDLWVNVIPGIALGNDFRAGIYNNYAEVDTLVVANSVPGARESLSKESAAFLIEYSTQIVYRLTYSWSIRSAYNLMYVDQVALANQNFNPRDMSNALNNSVFGINRFPFINADGHAFYQGYSIGAEYLW